MAQEKFAYLPSFIRGSDILENPEETRDTIERNHIHARNLLRHLIRGTPLCLENNDHYTHSFLAKKEIVDTLLVQRDPALMQALREEMQNLMQEAYAYLANDNTSDEGKKRCETFLTYILSSYPFMHPEHNEKVSIPVKIANEWEMVEYHFEKIDISPRVGPLASILEDQDRIYAYGLVPTTPDAPTHLLLMGTTYPGGQGSALADLYNFKPLHSVGEGHSFTRLGEWLQKHRDVIVSGHSKGATMAMIVAAKWPAIIKKANCFNPAGLAQATLDRYKTSWENLEVRPEINVMINQGDFVPYIDKGFLPHTNITRIIVDATQSSINFKFPGFLRFFAKGYEAHIHHFHGRSHIETQPVTLEEMHSSVARQLLSDVKWIGNWLLFPINYVSLCVKILWRKTAILPEILPLPFISSILELTRKLLEFTGKIIAGVLNFAAIIISVLVGLPVGLIKVGANKALDSCIEDRCQPSLT